MDRALRRIVLVLVAVVAGCTTPPPAGAPQPGVTQVERAANDALLTTAVKAKLIALDPDSTTSLGVKAVDGVVTLTGAVRTPAARTRTVDAARTVPGVKAVRDELHVDSKLPNVAERVGDAAIAARIATAILAQTGSAAVHVAVAGGVVTLSGSVPDAKVRAAALEAARHTTGVRDVVDQMKP